MLATASKNACTFDGSVTNASKYKAWTPGHFESVGLWKTKQ
ncbi:hypothetical protein RBWH47_04123 [Rhodopirellula baltica WH47]|uniref:Uncharacterized protein n=1 Tax=Rhodopirellula baltica WH47 TaxID=991778 RepID=F2ATD9_RHOBT|nr:hypothetical protein RBWH47_04123 [Rhodopirellula baltica WH47]